MRAFVGYIWAAPATGLGLLLGMFGCVGGGGIRVRRGAIEIWGHGLSWALYHLPLCQGAGAMTFGHVILGANVEELDHWRDHELIHVRQYERLGPLFLPMYLWLSLCLYMRGRDPYVENPFEQEAYKAVPHILPPLVVAAHAARNLCRYPRSSG